jgi:hypothetical protein
LKAELKKLRRMYEEQIKISREEFMMVHSKKVRIIFLKGGEIIIVHSKKVKIIFLKRREIIMVHSKKVRIIFLKREEIIMVISKKVRIIFLNKDHDGPFQENRHNVSQEKRADDCSIPKSELP